MSEIVKAFFLSTYIAQSIIEDQSWLRLDGNRSFQIYAFYGFYRRDLGGRKQASAIIVYNRMKLFLKSHAYIKVD